MSVGSTASTIRDEEIQELGLEAATQAAEVRAARSRRNQDRRDNRPSPPPAPPRPVGISSRISIRQYFNYHQAEEARKRQNNGEVVAASRTVLENADDVVRPGLPLLLDDQVFDEYPDTDSPGHSDDDASYAYHSSDDAPSLIQTIAESEIDEPSGRHASERIEPVDHRLPNADADDEDEETSPPRKKQKRGWEDTSQVDEESEQEKDEGPRSIKRAKKQIRKPKEEDE